MATGEGAAHAIADPLGGVDVPGDDGSIITHGHDYLSLSRGVSPVRGSGLYHPLFGRRGFRFFQAEGAGERRAFFRDSQAIEKRPQLAGRA